jgi:hypothetical protein
MLRILLIFIVVLGAFFAYQFQKPVISKVQAISEAKRYFNIVVEQEKLHYNTEKVSVSSLEKDDAWNILIGNRIWNVFIDGVAIDLEANTGEFIRMIFPTDGVITKNEHSEWFD